MTRGIDGLGWILFAFSLHACGSGTGGTIEADEDMGVLDTTSLGVPGGTVPINHGYFEGQRVSYWQFGGAPRSILPIYTFPGVPGQGSVVASVNANYTPWWRVNTVAINDGVEYSADDLKTVASILAARDQGLLTVTETENVVDCPVVEAETSLQGDPANRALESGWTEGRSFNYFSFEVLTIPITTTEYPLSTIHVLIDVSGTPRVESGSGAGMDLNGDGDDNDSNNVLSTIPEDADHSPLWTINEREVPGGYPAVQDSLSNGPTDTTPIDVNIMTDATATEALTLLGTSGPVNCPVVTDSTGSTMLGP